MSGPRLKAFRGAIVHALGDPGDGNDEAAVQYFEDGILVVAGGVVREAGPADELLKHLPRDIDIVDCTGRLVMPGFVDTHIHFPQIDIIASYGAQLLDWLNDFTFPAETRFGDASVAREAASYFIGELLRNGTTTAMVFASVHPCSVDAVFQEARAHGMCLVAGKVLMDRNCPENLRDTAASGYAESKALIEKWHGVERLSYAITPRFAITSSEEQLSLAGRLAREHPDVFVQTHLAENIDEVDWVRRLFPERRSYLDVYDHHGLVRERAVYAHCIHLDDTDRARMGESGAAASFCPTSNLFLGSGLFNLEAMDAHRVRTGMGTDIGGGTTYNLLRTVGEGYKVLQLQGRSLTPLRGFYLATLGGARALYLDDQIGNFVPGKAADFVVVDPGASSLTAYRFSGAKSVSDLLFGLSMLGDDRNIESVYVAGERV